MDFFEHQDAARRSTTKLVFFFICAVVGIVISVNAVVLVVYNVAFITPTETVSNRAEVYEDWRDFDPTSPNEASEDMNALPRFVWFHPTIVGIATLATLLVFGERMFT
ncbi:MAG: hypothetical protein AAF656_10630 [Planctomycetota bacterium]